MAISVRKAGILRLAMLGVAFVASSCSRSPEKASSPEAVTIPDSVYIDQGNRIVAATFDTLRNALMQAIQSRGYEEAISFCQAKAYPITATYADSVSLRRTALRVRNAANTPDSLEREVLEQMEDEMAASQAPPARLIREDGEIHFFKAIILQPLCQNCHGTPEKDIKDATLHRIRTLYPNDQAVDFRTGDLRGAWHVVFRPGVSDSE